MIIIVAVLSCIIAPTFANDFMDKFIIVYVAAVLVFIRRFKKWELENPFDGASLLSRKKYSRQKAEVTWLRAFEGKWDLHHRTGFKEFLIFIGKSSFIAGMAEKQPSSVVVRWKSPSAEDCVRIDSIGVPQVEGPWVSIGGDAVKTAQEGKVVFEKAWIDEEKKIMYRQRESREGAYINYQERFINDKGLLVTNVTYTRTTDNVSVKIYVEQKKKE